MRLGEVNGPGVWWMQETEQLPPAGEPLSQGREDRLMSGGAGGEASFCRKCAFKGWVLGFTVKVIGPGNAKIDLVGRVLCNFKLLRR